MDTLINGKPTERACRVRIATAGFTLVELLLVVVIVMVLTAIAIPKFAAALATYKLDSAVQSAELAIQTTRYQAIMHGYQYQVAFDSTQNTYQVSSEPPPAASFSNIGSSVPLSGAPITLSAATTLLLKPNGSVSATAGSTSFSIVYQGNSKTLTVSNYGSITVTAP